MPTRNRLTRWLKKSPLGPVARRLKALVVEPPPKPLPENDDAFARQVLRRCLPGTGNAVDVGAHEGDYLLEIFKASPAGRHFAIEPIPELAQALVKQFPKATIQNVALSDQQGHIEFSQFIELPSFSGIHARTDVPAHVTKKLIPVQTMRLDDLLPPELPIQFIKVDVEGAELAVFRGATRTLRTFRPCVIFEHGLGAIDLYQTTPEMVFDLLSECGLKIRTIVGTLRGHAPFNRAAFVATVQAGKIYNFVAEAN